MLSGSYLLMADEPAPQPSSEQPTSDAQSAELPEQVTFNAHIRPIMSNTCFVCHGPDVENNPSEFRIDSFASATAPLPSDDEMHGIVPGDLENSEVYQRIMGTGYGEQMPPHEFRHQLSEYETSLIGKWIEQGAEYERHWAYAAVSAPPVPSTTTHAGQAFNEIDAFIQSRLERQGIEPSATADKATLLRRLSLDLTGLPPTPTEVEAFRADTSEDAYETQVERLLASPHFGERMASSWLDIVRFADTVGFHGDQNMRDFAYRDYVIKAFNENKPFDEFTRQQIAGDLKPNPTTEDLVATGLLRLNMVTREGGAQPGEYLAKYKADRVRMIGTAWLGSTMACCECHDHKFDPFSAKDFYSMGAFFDDIRQWGVYTSYAYTPNEDLKGFNNNYPFPPEMRISSPSLRDEINALSRERDAEILKQLGAEAIDLNEMVAWKTATSEVLDNYSDGWVPLSVKHVETSAGTQHRNLDDGSVLLTGKPTRGETVEISGKPEHPTVINSIRLQVLPDERNGGNVGRNDDGRFELEFSASVIRSESDEPKMRPNRPRYVRIELPGKQILSLAEVEIFSSADSDDGNPINIAPRGKATQSSRYKTADANLAIDGNTEGNYYKANSVTHTALDESNPWWEIDLGSEQSVDSIVVWNRTDQSYASRLKGFRLILLDKDRHVLQRETPGLPKPSTEVAIADEVLEEPEISLPIAWGEADRRDPLRYSGGAPPRTLGEVWRSGPTRWQLPANEQQLVHTAVYHLDQPLQLDSDQQLVVRLKSGSVGRVRLSVTPLGSAIAGWPAASPSLTTAWNKPAAKRDQRDHAAHAGAFYLSTTPAAKQSNRVTHFRNAILDRHSGMAITLVTQPVPADQIPISRVRPRGDWQDDSGALAPPAVPHFLPPPDVDSDRRLNRTDLANWLTSDDNPLVPRHLANRTWKHFLGTGLSAKLDDLGNQGEWPSHPLLLDWLASELVRSGWDVKHLIRLIVLSHTYQQAVTDRTELAEVDPYNRLLAQASPRRLEAETIRDNALAIAGLLNTDYIGGPSIYPYQPAGHYSNLQFPNRRYTASDDSRQYRRGVYMHWQRTFLHPMLVNFDAPSRDECTADRSLSNSPQQALTLLNDPTFVEASHAMATSLLTEHGEESFSEILGAAFTRALARDARSEELQALQALYQRQLQYFADHPDDTTEFLAVGNTESSYTAPAKLAAWSQVCRVILNLHETITRY
ncbi:DUF1553 domain-containing protein [Allorhodopirellula solitaria]|nr:DUF1553 domain-containing protein [Allorhodopirellula solitaria]